MQAVVRLLDDSATPVALFTIGAVLWRAGQHAGGRTLKRDYVPVARIIMTSTVLAFATFPLLAWVFGVRPV